MNWINNKVEQYEKNKKNNKDDDDDNDDDTDKVKDNVKDKNNDKYKYKNKNRIFPISPENQSNLRLRPLYSPPTFINPFYTLNSNFWYRQPMKYINFAPTMLSNDKILRYPQTRPVTPYNPIYVLIPLPTLPRYNRYDINKGYNKRQYNTYRITDDSSEEEVDSD